MAKRARVDAFEKEKVMKKHFIQVGDKEFILTDMELTMFPSSVLAIQFPPGIPCNDPYDADPVLFNKYVIPLFRGSLTSLKGIPSSEIRSLLEMMDYFCIQMYATIPGIRALPMKVLDTLVKEKQAIEKEIKFVSYFNENIHSKLFPVGNYFAITGCSLEVNKQFILSKCKEKNIHWDKWTIFSRVPHELYDQLVEQARTVILAAQKESDGFFPRRIPSPKGKYISWGKMGCSHCEQLDNIIQRFREEHQMTLSCTVSSDENLTFYV